ncbi:MAG TPA: GNAT family protein [Gaiellaceae bacterium]
MLHYPDPPLTGLGFVLRPYGLHDVEADLAAVEHPSSARWVNSHSSGDPAGEVRMLEAELAADRMLVLTIADPDDDRYLGAIVLFAREAETGELAYVVAPEARGRGLAPRALRTLGDWAFAELGMQRLQLRIEPGNEVSHAVALRAGYEREGTLRSAFVVRGRRADVVMYSRLPTDRAVGS